jgi:hypothetical protein
MNEKKNCVKMKNNITGTGTRILRYTGYTNSAGIKIPGRDLR